MAKPHIILIIPRGEAVRNFLYSDTLKILKQEARVTILSVITDHRFLDEFAQHAEIELLPVFTEHRFVRELRKQIHEAHFRWLWSKVAQNTWEIRAYMADTALKTIYWGITRLLTRFLAFRPILEKLTQLENNLSWSLRPDDYFVDLFQRLQPDMVFNCSHIHGYAGILPTRIAIRLGIPTAGFIFSWDNLTSRSRIFEHYHHYFVWHEGMKQQLLEQYPYLKGDQVTVTGTPQFDYHFKPEFHLSREELCGRMGSDPKRPFIFYATGFDKHFPQEYKHVRFIAEYLQTLDESIRPQLLVRTYAKGVGAEMRALAQEGLPDVVFPRVLWDEKWLIPAYEDLAEFTSCLNHAMMGINAASTVSLELMMFDKPVMNIGFDPPNSTIHHAHRWERHIYFDHFAPVAQSGGVEVAWNQEDMKRIIRAALETPDRQGKARHRFIESTFADKLRDGRSGERIANQLLEIVRGTKR